MSERPEQQRARKRSPGEIAEALRSSAGILSVAASRLRVSRTTLYKWIRENPDLEELRREADEEIDDLAEGKLVEAIRNGESWAISLRLRYKAKRGYSDRVVLSGDPEAPLVVRPDVSGLTREELERWERVLASGVTAE